MTKIQNRIFVGILIGLIGLIGSIILLFNVEPDSKLFTLGEISGYIFTTILCVSSILTSMFPLKD